MAFDCLLIIFPIHALILNVEISIYALFIYTLTLYRHEPLFTPTGKYNYIADIKLRHKQVH
jgi:hypothetical protein